MPEGKGNCKNDGEEQVGPNNSKRSLPAQANATRFLLASGKEIIAPRGATIGDTVVRVVPLNGTLYDEQLAAGHQASSSNEGNPQSDAISENLVLQYDHVVKQLGK